MTDIIKIYKSHANKEQAVKMKAYMRDQFEFLGLPSPLRRELAKEWLKEKVKEKVIDWDLVEKLWQQEEREFIYLATDYLRRLKKVVTFDDLDKIKALAQQKSWWDSVDNLDELVGIISQIDESKKQVRKILIQWSKDEDFWIRRLAIDHQLSFKGNVDAELLAEIIKNNFGSDEFFINKAIGWALRDYSKYNPDWVRAFVKDYGKQMAPLSIREASKYI
ncbi:MAG: DNA alkylation repair protein [Streptococcaceae bacterium]|nr:DNA alkylation repair protein [Streptococcaceae bacterium]MCL2858678.1 DNA alkylation repair protein [Streptococcaceae bacterium]